MSSMYNSSNFSLWILQIIAFNLLSVMLFLSHFFNLLNALKDLSAAHELSGDTINNCNRVCISENNILLR